MGGVFSFCSSGGLAGGVSGGGGGCNVGDGGGSVGGVGGCGIVGVGFKGGVIMFLVGDGESVGRIVDGDGFDGAIITGFHFLVFFFGLGIGVGVNGFEHD